MAGGLPRIVIAASYHFTWQAPVGILIIFNIEQIDLHFGTLIMQQLLYGSRGGGGGRGSCLYPKIMHDKNCIKISLSQCVCVCVWTVRDYIQICPYSAIYINDKLMK